MSAPTLRAPRQRPSKAHPSTPKRSGADPVSAGRRLPRHTRYLVVGGLSLFLIYSVAPVWWLIVNATKDSRDLLLTNGLWFADFNLIENLRQIATYQDGIMLRWTANSLLFAVVGGGIGTVIALMAGYGLARFQFRGRGLCIALVVGSFLIPYSMLTLPLYLLFSRMGLTNTLWAVLIPTIINPFSVYLAKVYTEASIPKELLEAARLDGAGEARIFFSIVIRMMPTAGATIFLLAFVASWNGFFLPITMLQDSENWTMTLGLYNWLRQSQVSNASTVDFTSIVITGSLLSVIPMALVMILLQRFWRTGVSLGALK